MVPVINSTNGYGLRIDAGCAMIFKDSPDESYMELQAAKEIDYYFIKGNKMDDVITGYRFLTGKVPLMPLHLFGYIQSKERYSSSDDLINTLQEFRRRKIPIDMIVQDWTYWPAGLWGTMSMNKEFYPDKKQLARKVHDLNARLMISIWPNAQNSPQNEDFRKRGYLLNGSAVYDAFNNKARDLYWEYAKNEFFDNGFDAWWCDASEPVDGYGHMMDKNYDHTSHKELWLIYTKALSDVV